MNKVINIFWNGFKNATLVFLAFFLIGLAMVLLNEQDGFSLMLEADTYYNAIKHPLVLGVYCLLIMLSVFNSYKKIALWISA